MSDKMTCDDRLDRLNRFIREGRLLRGKWQDTDDYGKERACLLVALAPEVGKTLKSTSCPVEVMPQWLAYLTPSIDDCGTEQHWSDVVRRYAELACRAFVLTAEDWRRLDYQCRAIAVREGRKNVVAKYSDVLQVIDDTLKLLDFASMGGEVTNTEWSAATSAAYSAASAAESAAESAAVCAATNAAESAASAAESAATSAAYSAASAADSAARSAAVYAARSAAESAAWDRMIDKWMNVIEDVIITRESGCKCVNSSKHEYSCMVGGIDA